MDIEELERILKLMEEHDLVEIELEDPERGTRVRLKKARAEESRGPVLAPTFAVPAGSNPGASPAAGSGPAAPEPEPDRHLTEVPSPMVGTFYRSPSPDSDPFVEVGDQIDEESVVCIIEAMKVMNEIKAEVAGEVIEVLAENGEAVEFGQPLLLVRTE